MQTEKFTPGQRTTGAGAEIESGETFKPKDSTDTATAQLTGAPYYRHLKREAAIMALDNLDDPQDAAVICATYLDEIGAGSPRLDYWGDVREEADHWTFSANAVELVVYFTSILKHLPNQSLGIKAKKRIICALHTCLSALFTSLSDADQAAFRAWKAGTE